MKLPKRSNQEEEETFEQPQQFEQPEEFGGPQGVPPTDEMEPQGPDMSQMEPGMPDDQMPMDNGADMGGNGDVDDIVSLLNKLTDTDKKAAKGYIESMIDREESQNGADSDPQNQEVQTESVSFSKGQLKKIYEQFGEIGLDRELDARKLEKKRKVSKKSPFSSPDLS